jgi:uncharacterized protein YndB with AHSA1/START domain
MTERSVTHATFVVERAFDASPARVFAAWADPEAKARWFGSDEKEGSGKHELNFRVGGKEFNSGSVDGNAYSFEALYQDIVPDERIVYTYEMQLDETRISVSLGTVELRPEAEGTRLTYTEQGAFLDGLDTPEQRQQGTGGLFDALAEELQRQR